jgi:hypothetical protein
MSVTTPTVIEIDYTNGGGAGTFGFDYVSGMFAFSFNDFTPAAAYTPESILIEYFTRYSGNPTGNWVTVGTILPASNTTVIQNRGATLTAGGGAYVAKIRLTFTPRPNSSFMALTAARYFAGRPGTNEAPQFLLSDSQTQQRIYTPGVRIAANATSANNLIIGPGTLQFNGGATQTASLRGTKTIGAASTADTVTVTGATVGDIARVSRGKDAYVSAPNTVTFDSTGLAGIAVTAIVERFT